MAFANTVSAAGATKSPSPATDSKKTMKKTPGFSGLREMVTFKVGEEGKEETMMVHKEFACHFSPVLEVAFNSTFLEDQTQTYRFEDTSAIAVRLLIEWFYTQKFTIFDDGNGSKLPVVELVRLWVLADKLLLPRLQNLTIDIINQRQAKDKIIAIECINMIYESTSEASPLRRLIVDYCAFSLVSTAFKKYPKYYPHEMLIDLATVANVAIANGTKHITSNYHVPEDAIEKK